MADEPDLWSMEKPPSPGRGPSLGQRVARQAIQMSRDLRLKDVRSLRLQMGTFSRIQAVALAHEVRRRLLQTRLDGVRIAVSRLSENQCAEQCVQPGAASSRPSFCGRCARLTLEDEGFGPASHSLWIR